MSTDKIQVKIDIDLKELVPTYLERVESHAEKMLEHLENGDFESIRSLGHNLKGSGGGYGFDRISEIGLGLEMAAKSSEVDEIKKFIGELKEYLQRIEVEYVQ